MLTAIISFITGSEGGTGWARSSDSVKKSHASKSLEFNLKNPEFMELFSDDISKLGINYSTKS